MVLGKLDIHLQKKDKSLISHHIQSHLNMNKRVKYLSYENARWKTKENASGLVWTKFCVFLLFLIWPQNIYSKSRTDKYNHIKLKRFCPIKKTSESEETAFQEAENIYELPISKNIDI